MKINFFAPSFKRPEKSITQVVYPIVKLVVCESQTDAYLKNGNEIVVCPDKIQGNVSRVRNWILDQNKDADANVIMDDDMKWVGRWNKQEIVKLDNDGLIEMAEMAVVMCKDSGIRMFGLNCSTDKGAYREHTPFSFVSYISSPITGHVDNDLRYDEKLSLKEDYDMTLQQLNKYRAVLRLNMFRYECKQAEQKGGCASYRNYDEEKKQFLLLQKKWGTKIVQRDQRSKREFDFNPILKIPIRGV